MKNLNRMVLISTLTLGLVACGNSDSNAEKSKAIQEVKQESTTVKEKTVTSPNISQKEQEEVIIKSISKTKDIQSQFEKIKNGMPKMVKSLEVARECLSKAESKDEANRCMDKAKKSMKDSGMNNSEDEDEEDFSWDKAGKEKILRETDEGIKVMKKSLPCIEKATNFMDIMKCQEY
jgi:hypothetical protein